MNNRIYTCVKFTGHYPVGTAAVVSAPDAHTARDILNTLLKRDGLIGDAKMENMIEFTTDKLQGVILNNGDY